MPRKKIGWEPVRQRKLRVLKTLPGEVRDSLSKTMEKNAKKAVKRQKLVAPERSGDLISGISYARGDSPVIGKGKKFSVTGQKQGDPELTFWLFAGSELRDSLGWYARFVEFGHSSPSGKRAKPVPFWWPVIRLYRNDMKRSMQRALNKAARNAKLLPPIKRKSDVTT